MLGDENNVVCTPYANRGVTHTSGTCLNLSCDWVSVTSKKISDYEAVLSSLHLDFSLFSEEKVSRYSYKTRYNYNGIDLLVEHEHSYFMLDISGTGCRFLESLDHSFTWVDIFKIFNMYDLNFTRLDLALDSFNNTKFNLETLYNKLKKGHVKGRFRKFRNVEECLFSTGQEIGRTLYFGSPKSKVMFRFYDKFGESLSKGKEVDSNIFSWIRYEIQLRDDIAQGIIYKIILESGSDMGIYFCGFIRNYLEFLVPSVDSNKWRWKVCKWWLDFLNDIEKLPLNLNYKEPTILRKVEWLENAVSRTNALINLSHDLGVLNPLNFEIGYLKLRDSKKDLASFNQFRLSCGLDELTMNDFNNLIDLKLGIKKDDHLAR